MLSFTVKTITSYTLQQQLYNIMVLYPHLVQVYRTTYGSYYSSVHKLWLEIMVYGNEFWIDHSGFVPVWITNELEWYLKYCTWKWTNYRNVWYFCGTDGLNRLLSDAVLKYCLNIHSFFAMNYEMTKYGSTESDLHCDDFHMFI